MPLNGPSLGVPDLSERASWVVIREGDPDQVELPPSRSTGYLTHGIFRYVGKLPPPLVALLLSRYTVPGDLVLDPMCGGGTTAIEAVSSGRRSLNYDINPVSRLVTTALSQPRDAEAVVGFADRVAAMATPLTPPAELSKYFSADTYGLLKMGLELAENDAERALVLAIARRVSFANTKKINTVRDPNKLPVDARRELAMVALKLGNGLASLASTCPAESEVRAGRADMLGDQPAESVDFVLLHPPYLSNTAFSEVTELQLRLLGVVPERLRRSELAFRGSYFHVPNGLQKYLIGWHHILRETKRVLRPRGTVAVVVGDGSIDHVRVPVASITDEYANDLGFERVWSAAHKLNNQTGWTLSHRMTVQHVRVYTRAG